MDTLILDTDRQRAQDELLAHASAVVAAAAAERQRSEQLLRESEELAPSAPEADEGDEQP